MNRIRELYKNFDFDLYVNKIIVLYIAIALFSLIFNQLGISRLTVAPLEFNSTTATIDVYFIALYICIGIVSIQSLVLFLSTRELAFRAYCFYIAAIVIQVIFYEELYLLVDIVFPDPWRLNMRQSTGVLALALIYQFARVLLNTANTKLDIFLRISIVLELISAIGLQLGQSFFYLIDYYVMAVMGLCLIFHSSPVIRKRDAISTIFCVSFSFNYIAFFLSTAVFQSPETYLVLLPFYQQDADMAGRFIWVGGLTFEALFMSLAAYFYFLNLKKKSIELTSQTSALEKAIEKSKHQLNEMEARFSRNQPHKKKGDVSKGLREVIESYANEQFLNVSFLCKIMAMSQATLARRLKEETNMTPVVFIRQVRLERAKRMIENREARTVREVANACGFINHSHFSKHFQNAFGELPTEMLAYRKN